MDELDTFTLVERAQTGDRAAGGALFRRYSGRVYRFVYSRVRNKAVAEDLAQDVWVRALQGIGRFTWRGRDIGAWLTTIARNRVIDHFKSNKNRYEFISGESQALDPPDISPEAQPDQFAINTERNVELRAAVQALNPEQRRCITLRFLDGMSVAETAEMMGKNIGAVKTLQYRAMRSLARSERVHELNHYVHA